MTPNNTSALRRSRLRAIERGVARLDRRIIERRAASNRASWVRVTIFLVGFTASIAAFFIAGAAAFWICAALSIALFSVAIRTHRRLESSMTRYTLLRQIKASHLARARLEWQQMPVATVFESRPAHPFEADLDLIGPSSLHQLLDTSTIQAGSIRLRDWLTAANPDVSAINARQDLVRELAPMTLFRDKLALNAAQAAGADHGWNGEHFLAWLESDLDAAQRLRPWLLVLGLLAAINITLFAFYWFGTGQPLWIYSLVIYAVVYFLAGRGTGAVFHEAMTMRDVVQQLAAVFEHLESFSYRNRPCLAALCAPFKTPGQSPSADLAQVSRVAAATGIQGNPLIALLVNAVAPWNLYFAYRLGAVKRGLRQHMPIWLESWTELEALASLANFAHLNPDYAFPELIDDKKLHAASVFDARELGHPLIPVADRVCNDFTFSQLGDVGLITGSNMAGKSTFLKTIGVSLALAHAGGPVAATRLSMAPLRLFTSIRISDSLTDGFSYFYAEVQRLKQLLQELDDVGAPPLLFLIDEIFRGTNNRERLIGSRAYVRALAGKRGVGLISTHDLELAQLESELSSLTNYHFRDSVSDGKLIFDYRLRLGPCPTTNALRIMALEGLPVESTS